jgi:hypothetical protein
VTIMLAVRIASHAAGRVLLALLTWWLWDTTADRLADRLAARARWP